jgi:large subunit ribosomal protein L30
VATAKKKASGKKRRLKITQIRSGVGHPETHRRTLKALGLLHQRSVVHEENEAIKGMLFQVRHMVKVEELEGEDK